MDELFIRIKIIIFYFLIFLTPFFFLPITQEFYTTNKFYLLVFGALLLLIVSLISIAVHKKLRFRYSSFSGALAVLIVMYASSLVISSPNKIQALTAFPFGFGMMIVLGLLYIIGIQLKLRYILLVLDISALVIAVSTVVFVIFPFQGAALPAFWQFLNNTQFTPLGTSLDRTLFLAFFSLRQLSYIMSIDTKKVMHILRWSLFFIIFITAFFISTYLMLLDKKQSYSLPPYSVSWYAAVETLKEPRSALIGVGIDNFESMFTRAKNINYNKTNVWNVNFTQSRSAFLHLMTETGTLGVLAFFLVYMYLFKRLFVKERVLMIYLLVVFFLFPPSFILLFLFFMLMIVGEQNKKDSIFFAAHFRGVVPLFGFIGGVFILIITLGYFVIRAYSAEYVFKQAIDRVAARGNVSTVYNTMREAVTINPFIERFRSSFSGLHLAIANNIVASKKPEDLNAQDRQNITRAIQASISEARAVTALNPEKSNYWADLASLYDSLIGVVQDADKWSITSYERAIMIDPINPILRFNMGGIYYRGNNFNQAVDFFTQAVRLKPDWSNAQYNLAWAFFQKKDYEQAASIMENVLTLVEAKSPDFKRASKDLDEFKKQIPKKETEQNPSQEGKAVPHELTLPQQTKSEISPPITLPTILTPTPAP